VTRSTKEVDLISVQTTIAGPINTDGRMSQRTRKRESHTLVDWVRSRLPRPGFPHRNPSTFYKSIREPKVGTKAWRVQLRAIRNIRSISGGPI